ncbi:GNAT family N-acetyltransferase [Tateyamaria omphalii]|uniref:GNAT family N-acetyltransferase n=1 Tax=Tateyamaria omphalii TaxID=299262 RepID=UPI001C992380|nr:GNAT family N-acetyltransferase [Tateyamaria omphalii]MBY5932742.1 GNAT family N-acetyltransferase [Tateyamaria omphalii]
MSKHATSDAPINVARDRISLSEARPFLKRCFVAAYPAFVTSEMLAHLEQVQAADILANDVEDRILVTARRNTQLFGMGVGVLRHATFYVWGFYVAPELQRTGLGRRIMAVLCADLPDDTVVELHVYTESHDALAFYATLGFRKTGDTRAELFPGQICNLSILSAKRTALRL